MQLAGKFREGGEYHRIYNALRILTGLSFFCFFDTPEPELVPPQFEELDEADEEL